MDLSQLGSSINTQKIPGWHADYDGREMREQVGNFDYGYNMYCGSCDQKTFVSAQVYHERECIDARVPCDHCSAVIHYGPYVTALRDEDDPAMDNEAVSQLVWYHTSTSYDWPSPTHSEAVRAKLANHRVIAGIPVEELIEHQISQAVHVGTYEAAIENMLRRMRDQDDAAKTFYLHRVTLKLLPSQINTGYRDENHETASQLTIQEIQAEGLLAIRYLNVRESAGSLSLAVVPQAIEKGQSLRLPPTGLARAADTELLTWLNQQQAELDQIDHRSSDTSAIPDHQLCTMQLGRQPDSDGIAQQAANCGNARRRIWDRIDDRLARAYLSGPSPSIAENFQAAFRAWRNEHNVITVAETNESYASAAVILTRPAEVVALLRSQPVRIVNAG